MKKLTCILPTLSLLLIAGLLPACRSERVNIQPIPHIIPLNDVHLAAIDSPPYLTDLGFTPENAQYFDLVNKTLNLTETEIEILTQNGFVVSDRLTWNRFIEAYAWIYWQDLPVLITTDSILHAVHQSYSDLLKNLEYSILIPKLNTFLQTTQTQVMAEQAANTDKELAALYRDLETYLSVAIALLNNEAGDSAPVRQYVALATSANTIARIDLFGSKRDIDFSLFEPRGHYAEEYDLANYFRAMSWLAQVDFRFVEYDALSSMPILNVEQIATATILRNAIDTAKQRETWQQINGLFEVLIGSSDNMTLPDLDRFLADIDLNDPAQLLHTDPDKLLRQLTSDDYGQQRITGQIIQRHINNDSPNPIPRPVSFMLLGQRFGIDSYVMSNLVYDRLMVDGQPIERALPSPLDVMYVLGNDHAVTHLTNELEAYQYDGYLAALRQQVDNLDPGFWHAPIYNQWLAMIRTLDSPTTHEAYPQAMRTEAWADKMLQTQLASWAQLRHDNILYVKQPFTTQVLCEYPAGYVEPYPEFFAALYNFAQTTHSVLTQLNTADLNEQANSVQQNALIYFERIMFIADRLQSLAEKELRLEEFTPAEEAFIKSITIRQIEAVDKICAIVLNETWDGWYVDMFYDSDNNPAVIADIHTNPNNDPSSALYPPRVLHVASGPVAPIFFIVDTDEGPTLYVGPAFTYFELVEEGQSLIRLTDQDWREQLNAGPYPTVPEWVRSFRLPVTKPEHLLLPNVEN